MSDAFFDADGSTYEDKVQEAKQEHIRIISAGFDQASDIELMEELKRRKTIAHEQIERKFNLLT